MHRCFWMVVRLPLRIFRFQYKMFQQILQFMKPLGLYFPSIHTFLLFIALKYPMIIEQSEQKFYRPYFLSFILGNCQEMIIKILHPMQQLSQVSFILLRIILIVQKLPLRYKYIIAVMYSKYLDYSEPATKAHLSAQAECEQKDVIISQLKNEIFQLKQLEGDYHRLNELISALEGKYSLLLAEKDRSEKDQKVKFDIDKKATIDLRGEIDDLRVQLQKSNLVIEELLRQNTNIKRQCDGRSAEIQSIRFQIKQAENKNQRSNDQNKSLGLSIKGLKEQRKRLEDQCEELSALLDSQIAKLKNVEKDVRNIESANARLEKTLYQAEKDNSKLVGELKEKNDQIKRAQNKFKGVNNSIAELEITYKNLEQQADKTKSDLDRNTAILQNEVNKGREIQGKIASVESVIRTQQNELDLIISEQQKLRKQHFACLDKNKNLNNEIDRVLSLIAQYELVNKELLDEIQIFIDQDVQARSMLDRKEFMRQVIESSIRKIALTEEPIRHLKC